MKNKDRKVVDVKLWGDLVGKVSVNDKGIGFFKYAPEFLSKGIEPSPYRMPVKKNIIYSFPRLNKQTFKGLPGMIADSLPDAYGDHLLNIYFEKEGIKNSVDIELLKLSYMSSKATGALEYAPPLMNQKRGNHELSINSLLDSVDRLISSKKTLEEGDLNDIHDIISVGSSLGGAAPKAVIDIDFKTNSIRPGNIPNTPNYEPWIIKFDAVKKEHAINIQDTKSTGFGNVEYAYYLMAKRAGITMNPCRLYHDSGRSHFMTKRFDRSNGEKLHMQTLHAIAHMDSYFPHDYNKYFKVFSGLKLNHSEYEEMYRRIVFNGLAGNTDTHTKNTSFLMNKEGRWSLSPCYDLICSISMKNNIERHKTLINGKSHNFTKQDFMSVARKAGIKESRANEIIDKVSESLSQWNNLALESGVREEHIKHIKKHIDKNLKLSVEKNT